MPERPPLKLIEGGASSETRTPPRPHLGRAIELASLGFALTLTFVWLAKLPSWFHDLGRFQALYAVAFALYALALTRIPRYADLPRVGFVVFAVALAARAALLATPPSLSGDIYRYVWEGKVVAHGGNPYRQAPSDTVLAPLRDTVIYPKVNHPHLSTIYPPVAMGGFALIAKLSPTVTAFKLWVILHDLALVLILLAWARRARRSPALVIAYAWNPLMLIEYAGSGHNDPTAMLWLALALMWSDERPLASAVALVLGGLTKLAPLMALPFLILRWPWRARLLSLGALGVGLSWFFVETRHADSGVLAYWRSWRNNELFFHYLESWTGSFDAARMITSLVLVLAVGFALWKRWTPEHASQLAARVGLLVSPVLHPWYLGWALMFETRQPSAAWLLLSFAVILNYGVLATPAAGRDFHLSLTWRWIEYGLPLCVAAGVWLWVRAARGNGFHRAPGE